MLRFPVTRAVMTVVNLFGFSATAAALDGEDFAARLRAALESGGYMITYESVRVENSEVILDDVVAASARASADMAAALHIGSVIARGVAEAENGGYTAASVVIPPLGLSEGAGNATLGETVVTGLSVPAAASTGAWLQFEEVVTSSLKLSHAGEEYFSIASMTGTQVVNGDTVHIAGSASGFRFALLALPGAQADVLGEYLALDAISGSFRIDASWDMKNGALAMHDLQFMIDHIGVMGGSFEIHGYTPDLAYRVQALDGRFEPADDPEHTQEELLQEELLQEELLMEIGQLRLKEASFYFQDHGIVQPFVDLLAARHGVSTAQMVMDMQMVAEVLLAGIDPVGHDVRYADAVVTFLAAPDAVRISAEPADPVAFASIAEVLTSAPRELPRTLGITIGVND